MQIYKIMWERAETRSKKFNIKTLFLNHIIYKKIAR